MRVIEKDSIIEEVLDAWAEAMGADRASYGGHAYRVFNFARGLVGTEGHDRDLAIASIFHDLGIWSDQTFDYLGPSSRRATEYLLARGDPGAASRVASIVENHHCLLPVRTGNSALVVEAFRCADFVDLSGGLLRAGLDRGFVADVKVRFPYQGFHGVLLRSAAAWFMRHPLRPLPMLRLRAPR